MRAEYVPPEVNLARKRAWGDMSTGGSRGIRASVEYVRKGGAAARAMLVQAAAAQWNVPVAECRAADSVVTHGPTGRTLRYGELAEAASKLPVPDRGSGEGPVAMDHHRQAGEAARYRREAERQAWCSPSTCNCRTC